MDSKIVVKSINLDSSRSIYTFCFWKVERKGGERYVYSQEPKTEQDKDHKIKGVWVSILPKKRPCDALLSLWLWSLIFIAFFLADSTTKHTYIHT